MKILFFTVFNSTFTEKDYKILNSAHDVTKVNPELLKIKSILKLYNHIQKCDAIFLWFASLNFIIPVIVSRLLNKKIYIVAGGYDVASVKEIKYGSCYKLHKRFLIRLILNFSTKIFAVSKSNRQEIITNCKINSSKIVLIYHGFKDVSTFDFEKKQNKILTIVFLNNVSFRRKGIDKFFLLAEMMPEIEYTLMGYFDDSIKNIIKPQNLKLLGFVTKEKFEEVLSNSKIYIQLSIHEGFGCSVAEAMQYGCIPIVSNNYSLPEVVGDCGLVLNSNNSILQLPELINKILADYNPQMGNRCINKIRNDFSLRKRHELLLKHINS